MRLETLPTKNKCDDEPCELNFTLFCFLFMTI